MEVGWETVDERVVELLDTDVDDRINEVTLLIVVVLD